MADIQCIGTYISYLSQSSSGGQCLHLQFETNNLKTGLQSHQYFRVRIKKSKLMVPSCYHITTLQKVSRLHSESTSSLIMLCGEEGLNLGLGECCNRGETTPSTKSYHSQPRTTCSHLEILVHVSGI